MTIVTPDQAVEAREFLNLSQTKVAKETGISRSYLSQFEGSKRVLEDHHLERLYTYYVERGWQPGTDAVNSTVEQRLNSDKHGLTIMDGFVVAESVGPDLEMLLDEYYGNSEEIASLLSVEIDRGFFGGLDTDDAQERSLRPLLLMARQYEIKQMLHGQYEPVGEVVDPSAINTVGDYVNYLLANAVPDRLGTEDYEPSELDEAV